MSIKQFTMCQCDVCGMREDAKQVQGKYNDTEYTIPENWYAGYVSSIAICPDCARKLGLKRSNAG